MKEETGVGCLYIFILCLWVFSGISWAVNVYRFVKLDFEPSYKAEIIHGVGLFSPVCWVAAWIPVEDKKEEVK
jgi:hypothetical protein